MDPNAGWFAVAGALAAGVPSLVGTVVEAVSKRNQRDHDTRQAEAARAAEAKQAEAQREHEQRQAEIESRRSKVREWREGLAAAHKAFKEWDVIDTYSRREGLTRNLDPEPNLVGLAWFQSLREHLSPEGAPNQFTMPNYYRNGPELVADDNAADVLGREISRLEREWNV